MFLFSYLVDSETRNLLVKNKTNILIRIGRGQYFSYIFEINNKFVIIVIVFIIIAIKSPNKDNNLFFDTVKI
jgi:ABC-type iron transport system FetAB permease component